LDFVSGMTERLTQFKGAGDAAISMLGGMGGLHKEAAKLTEYDIVSGLHERLSGTNLDEERKRLLAQAFGMDANMRAAFEKSGDWSNVKVSDLISNKEAGQGMKGQIAIENFKRSLALSMKGIANAFTPAIMKSLTEAVRALGELVGSFVKFSESAHLVDILTTSIKSLSDALKDLNAIYKNGEDIVENGPSQSKVVEVYKNLWSATHPGLGLMRKAAEKLFKSNETKELKDSINPKVNNQQKPEKSGSIEMNQTVNIAGDFTNPADITEALNKANQNAYRQFGAQLQVV